MSDEPAPITPETNLPEPTHRFLDDLRNWIDDCITSIKTRLDAIDQNIEALQTEEEPEAFPVGTIMLLVPNPEASVILGPGGEETITLSGTRLNPAFYVDTMVADTIADTDPIEVGEWISVGTPTVNRTILPHSGNADRFALNFRRIS